MRTVPARQIVDDRNIPVNQQFINGAGTGFTLTSINDPLPVQVIGGNFDVTTLLVEDANGYVFIRKEITEDEETTVIYQTLEGEPGTPVAPITILSVALPEGAATSALQVSQLDVLQEIQERLPESLGQKTSAESISTVLAADQPPIEIEAEELPLPIGASTSAKQDAQTTALYTVDNSVNTGFGSAATSSPFGTGVMGWLRGIYDKLSNVLSVAQSGVWDVGRTWNLGSGSDSVTANIGTTNGLALDSSVNTLLKPGSTLAEVGQINGTVTVKADITANQTYALKVDGSAVTQPVSLTSVPLASGAATSANQTTGNTSLSNIDTGIGTDGTSPPSISGTGVRGWLRSIYDKLSASISITAASLPLPTGAATSANQTTAQASFTSIDGKLPAQESGRVPTILLSTQQIVNRDYDIEVSRGLIAGVVRKTINGYNSNTGTTQEPIWAQSGTAYPWPTAATTITVSSTSINDTSAGSGARTVAVTYIDFTTRAEVTTIVALNGLTAVTVTTNAYRVNNFAVVTWGGSAPNGANVGTLFVGSGLVTLGTPATIYSSIVPGKNIQQQAVYTVPVGKTFEPKFFRFTTSALCTFRLLQRTDTQDGFYTSFDLPLQAYADFTSLPLPIAEKSDIIVTAAANSGTIRCGLIFTGYLKDS